MITKKKIKTFKSNKEPLIVGSSISITISPNPKPSPHKIYLALIFLRFIGANETIFEIPAIFADKSYPLTPIPPGNINPVQVVSKPVAASHPMKLVADNVLSVTHLKNRVVDLVIKPVEKKNLSLVFDSYHPHSAVSHHKPPDLIT